MSALCWLPVRCVPRWRVLTAVLDRLNHARFHVVLARGGAVPRAAWYALGHA
jgi:hypothetical protein